MNPIFLPTKYEFEYFPSNEYQFASQTIDIMATELPEKKVFYPAMEYITRYLSSANLFERRTGLVALAV